MSRRNIDKFKNKQYYVILNSSFTLKKRLFNISVHNLKDFLMKAKQKTVCGLFAVILALAFTAMSFTTCDDGGDIPVTLSSVSADGSSSQTTTQLTLTLSQAITSLTAADITLSGVSGVSKGTLSGSGPTYTLPISGFTLGGTLSVSIAKSGYDISGSPKSTTIYYYNSGGGSDISVTFSSLSANGSST
jgi:hypothetical protein